MESRRRCSTSQSRDFYHVFSFTFFRLLIYLLHFILASCSLVHACCLEDFFHSFFLQIQIHFFTNVIQWIVEQFLQFISQFYCKIHWKCLQGRSTWSKAEEQRISLDHSQFLSNSCLKLCVQPLTHADAMNDFMQVFSSGRCR